MKHNAFTELVAHATAVPHKTVAVFARNLKSAGLLTSGARGVNAPEMTLLDLTRMLIALCATDRPSDAVEMANRYCKARTTREVTVAVGEHEIRIPEGQDLESLMAIFLHMPAKAHLVMSVGLVIDWNRLEAHLQIEDSSITFKADVTEKEQGEIFWGGLKGINTRRGLGWRELNEMSLPFALEREEGMSWEEMIESKTAASVFERHAFKGKGEAGN